MTALVETIRHLNPCLDAWEWLETFEDPKLAWEQCQRGDWMLWLLGKLSGPPESNGRKKLVLCACECARLALPYTKDNRALVCIETAEKWTRGEATIEQLRKAGRAAAYAAYAAYVTYAYAATYAAAAAADATYAYAATYAAAAADADAADAADAAYISRSKTLAMCADIVRKHYPEPPVITKEPS